MTGAGTAFRPRAVVGGAAHLTAPPRRGRTRLDGGPSCGPFVRAKPTRSAPVLETFFTVLLVLVCVGVLAFMGLTVKKLYQGQR